jgi:hypothetical protein
MPGLCGLIVIVSLAMQYPLYLGANESAHAVHPPYIHLDLDESNSTDTTDNSR